MVDRFEVCRSWDSHVRDAPRGAQCETQSAEAWSVIPPRFGSLESSGGEELELESVNDTGCVQMQTQAENMVRVFMWGVRECA